jgi:hypothetical protein
MENRMRRMNGANMHPSVRGQAQQVSLGFEAPAERLAAYVATTDLNGSGKRRLRLGPLLG